MRVEEEFSIVIEDEAASELHSVGQLHVFILARLELLDVKRCPSSATFYQLRRALVDLSVAPRRSIAPATPTAALLPASARRQMWKAWSRNAGVKLPALEKPRWMRAALWLAFALTLGGGPFFWATSNFVVLSYYPTTISLYFLAYRWSELHAIGLPADCLCVGDVTQAVMRLNYGINVEHGEIQSSEEVWEKLKAILVDELDVSPDEITENAQFVRDLRLD